MKEEQDNKRQKEAAFQIVEDPENTLSWKSREETVSAKAMVERVTSTRNIVENHT